MLATEPGSRAASDFARSRYASALLLMTAYASSAGGIATPIGTTTNVVAMGYFRQEEFFGRPIDFGRWSLVGLPMTLALGLALFVWMRLLAPAEQARPGGACGTICASERAKLGGWSAGERNTLVVFLAVVTLWVAPSVLLVGRRAKRRPSGCGCTFPKRSWPCWRRCCCFCLPVDWRRRQVLARAGRFLAASTGAR